jgi:hypothetical protein
LLAAVWPDWHHHCARLGRPRAGLGWGCGAGEYRPADSGTGGDHDEFDEAPAARRLGRIAAVGAVALLLAGSAAATAAARPKGNPNAEIDMGFRSNGDPYSFEFAGVWAVGCAYVNVNTGTE